MYYTFDSKVLEKYNLTVDEFLVLLLNRREAKYSETVTSLIKKGIADRNLYSDEEVVLSNNTKDIIASILVESDKKVLNKDEEFSTLAEKLRAIFPAGRKAGTNYMWRDSTAAIARKLKTLVAKFDFKFTEEQAINATTRYVNSFNGSYTYMQLLKYFILKTDTKTGELKSEFMSLIENEDYAVEGDGWTGEIK